MTTIAEFARQASAAVRGWTAFEARQTVRARGVEVEARVRVLPQDRVSVHFTKYQSQLAELDELLGGGAEFARDDLEGASLAFDGRTTVHVDPRATTALRIPGRHLYEPIPGYDLLGEVRALDDIARDFLLRDGGTSTAASRPTRVVGLKPKRTTASSAFRWVKFALERAEVAFDAETLFPLRIAFVPARDSGAAPLLGPDATVTVESSDVRRLDPDDDAAPALPADARVFEEVEFPIPQLTEVAPFRVPVDAARSMGYELVGDSARLVLDAARERGYATLLLAKPDERGRAEGVVTLRVGNYLSRWMARRRTLATERGERVDESGVRANYLDRRTLWKASEGAEGLPALADLVWEKDGIFHVIAAEGVTREDLIALGAALI